MSALSVEDRRTHEEAMLRFYVDALRERGVSPPDWNDMWDAYRTAPAYGIVAWLSTLGAKDYQGDAICLNYIERFCTAYTDLDTEAVLTSAGPSKPRRVMNAIGHRHDGK
jgi:hypothetical protein